jgi:hypothetical protein
MKGRSAFLIGMAAGAVAAWLLDRRDRAPRRVAGVDLARTSWAGRGLRRTAALISGRDEAALVAPPTPMSGTAGAQAVQEMADEMPTPADEPTVQPTPATAGQLPLTDETAGGHQVLGGGPAATPPTSTDDG